MKTTLIRACFPGVLLMMCGGALFGEEAEEGKNLLINSSFALTTNPGIPDFCGGQSGWRRDAHQLVDEAFIQGTKSMKLSNADGQAVKFFTSNYGWLPEDPSKGEVSYTFSVFLKSNPTDLKVQIGSDRLVMKDIKVSDSWQRYEITGTLKPAAGWNGQFLVVEVRLPQTPAGELWINAPQLVRGDHALPYTLDKETDPIKTEKKDKIRDLSKLISEEWNLDKDSLRASGSEVMVRDKTHGNEATVVGQASWTSTPWGAAVYFDGHTYLKIEDSTALPNKDEEGFSLEVLLKPDADLFSGHLSGGEGQSIGILDKGFRFGGFLWLVEYNRYRLITQGWKRFDGPAVSPTADHLVVTTDPLKIKCYLNGSQFNETPMLDAKLGPMDEGKPLIIGGHEVWDAKKGYRPVPAFKGWIKLVRIYHATLTPDEVMSLYRAACDTKR